MTTHRIAFALIISLSATAFAVGPTVPGAYVADWYDEKGRDRDAPLQEFKWINYFLTRGTFTNQVGDPTGLKGVSLGPIGEAAGSATQVLDGRNYFYIEQRWIPVIEYSPFFVDGLAAFRAQFEIDYTWGRAANTVQHNEGGGFNADQVNIQTKNANVSIYPTKKPSDLAIVVGTQSFYDTVYDPARTPLNDIIRSGYKLAFLGTDATGLSVYTSRLAGHARFSFIPVGSAQADKAAENDPRLKFIYLFTGDYSYQLQPGTLIGASAWYLRDDTKGDAYAYEGLVKSGPSSSGLGGFTGVPRFAIDRPVGDVFWAGLNFQHNIDFRLGRFGTSGFVMYNGGEYTNEREGSQLNPSVSISGVSANLELLYNWGSTNGDLITVEGLYSTGDSNLQDDRYTGAYTLNFYGLPGAVWFNHKTLVLFPFTSTVSNYTGAVTDISNQGFGLQTAIVTAAWDVVPNKLNLKVGAAHAQSTVTPPELTPGAGRGRTIGTEMNVELRYHIRYLMTLGLHAGYMFRGDFYDGNPRVTADPFAVFTTFTWYAF